MLNIRSRISGNPTIRRQPTRGHISCGLVNSLISQLAETFDLKFAVNNAINVIFVKLHH